MIIKLLLIFFISFSTSVFALQSFQDFNYIMPSPPKTEDRKALYNYLNILFNRWNILQLTTTEPNGNLDADIGQLIIYNNAGTYSLAVETTSPHGTVWKGIALGAI